MSTTYVLYPTSNTKPTMRSGCKFVEDSPVGNDTYTSTRAFVKFDLSPYGLVLSTIDTVDLIAYAATVFGSGIEHKLYSDTVVDNWGATLTGIQADFDSTGTNSEDTNLVDATGEWTFSVNPSNLNLSGTTYFRIACLEENSDLYEYVDWRTQNHASNHPVLRVTLKSGRRIFVVT